MAPQQLVRELHWLEWQMRKFEDKYGLRSSDFYAAMESGQLAEFDDMDHAAFQEFLEWHGLYKVWLKREKRYHESTISTSRFNPSPPQTYSSRYQTQSHSCP